MKLDIDKIDKEIKRRGWSMLDFANALESTRTMPYHIMDKSESGNHSFKTVVRVAKVLDFDPKDLLI